jgi:DNA end-binding protein Ku
MAAIWKGSLTFGLVNIPVELRTAVRADHISFRLLHEDDLSPVKYERICQVEGEPVPWNEIVKGYEYEKGKFVVMTDDDFKAAAIEKSKTIDILDFVKEDEIDPRYFETQYYLVPAKGADKA